MKKIFFTLLYLTVMKSLFSQNTGATEPPKWSKSLCIYEVNTRQYTPEGTFKALDAQLPRLKQLGVGILWLMPVNPIGVVNRKGSLGSYYSIQDYMAINPEYGTTDDFKKLVDDIHKQNMYVIVDWVANHTSWDNVWMQSHPEYYTHDKDGKIISPNPDWTDVADLNYDNPDLRKAMIATMSYWVQTAHIDGFRCDVAMMVPDDFWQEAIKELRKIKPDLFMLAEAEGGQFHDDGFDMTYSWTKYKAMNDMLKNKSTSIKIDSMIRSDIKRYPAGSYFMNFTSNHDENSWNGTEFERLDGGTKTFAALCATMPGMMLIYSGQEVGSNKRLRFFDKDTINWNTNNDYTAFYQSLTALKKNNPALWNGDYGGDYRKVFCNNDKVLCFLREKDANKILVIANMSAQKQNISITDGAGEYKDAFTGDKVVVKAGQDFDIAPWQYQVLIFKSL